MVAHDSHRQALRAAAPWVAIALGPLIVSVALPATWGAISSSGGPPAWLAQIGTLLGLLGSAAMLIGLMQLARARAGGRRHPALGLAFAFWVVEFVARMWPLQGGVGAPDAWLGAQLVASSISMWCTATGVLWILRRQQAQAALAPWKLARAAFAVLTLLLATLVVVARSAAPELSASEWLTSHQLGAALAWLAFATPWAALVFAVRASVRWLGRMRSTAEILAR